MSDHKSVWVLMVAGVLSDLAARSSLVALPLIALAWTGQAAQAGLAVGAMAVPLALSPWWTRRLREFAANGGVLGAVTIAQGVGVLVTPVAMMLDLPSTPSLIVSGLIAGAARTVALPARQALLADVEERRTGSPIGILAWQEAASRASGVVGPVVGAVVVASGNSIGLLVAESIVLACAGVLTSATGARGGGAPARASDGGAPRIPAPQSGPGPALREVLRGQAGIRRGWVIRSVAGLVWFALALGLAIEGAREDRPGLFYAISVGCFGLGSTVATLVVGRRSLIRPTVRLAAGGWVVNGLAWMLMGLLASPAAYAAGGLIGGLGAGVGFATVTRMIGQHTRGPARRTLLSGQVTIVETTTAVGMLCGGAVIAVIGVHPTLVLSGLALVLTSLVCGARAEPRLGA